MVTISTASMTNGETFIVVLVTLLPFLLMIGAAVWGGINSSKEIYQVVYKPATFTNSPWHYFFSLDLLLSVMLLYGGSLGIRLLLLDGITSSDIPMWLTYLLFSAFSLFLLFLGGHSLTLIIHYWRHTKDITIRFEPDTKTIYVESGTQEYILKEDTIESINLFTNEARMRFEYWQFKLKNGEEFALTSRARGAYGIFEYFKTLPISTHKTFFPFIR